MSVFLAPLDQEQNHKHIGVHLLHLPRYSSHMRMTLFSPPKMLDSVLKQ